MMTNSARPCNRLAATPLHRHFTSTAELVHQFDAALTAHAADKGRRDVIVHGDALGHCTAEAPLSTLRLTRLRGAIGEELSVDEVLIPLDASGSHFLRNGLHLDPIPTVSKGSC